MEDEPTLPRLPTVTWDAETQSFGNTRKRARNPLNPPPPLFNGSSDPAVFSSDDDPHVDNYTQGRHKKKRYVGTWFQQQPASSDPVFGEDVRNVPHRGKRTLERQMDSGVWMGSDDSLDLDMDGSVFEMAQPEPRLPQLRRPVASSQVSEAEEIVREKIEAAVELGSEDVDLSGLGLETISNSTISRLSEITYIPFVTEGVPFEQKDPSLRLYLANNPLRKPPGAIFNLEFLTVLSLRRTKIAELPASIGTLRNLQSLNLSLNRLRYLPVELLDLLKYPSKLVDLTIHPNPFHRPREQQFNEISHGNWDDDGNEAALLRTIQWEDDVTRVWLSTSSSESDTGRQQPQHSPAEISGWHVSLAGQSPVEHCDSRGTIASTFRLPTVSDPGQDVGKLSGVAVKVEEPHAAQLGQDQVKAGSRRSRVHSLLELALKACSRTMQIQDLPSYLPPNAPAHLAPLLRRIVEQGDSNNNMGDLPCSVCQQGAIVPMTQWIEWWSLSRIETNQRMVREQQLAFDQDEKAVPFLRRGCSWGCQPPPRQLGSALPGTLRWEQRQLSDWN